MSRAHARYHRALQRGALLAAPLCGHLTVAHGVLESTRTAGVLERFDPAAFVQGTGALYLLSKDGGGSASPLMAALTDRVLREATLGRATGRSARPPARRFPRRGGRRLPDRRPPPALQPPRVARHRAAHPAAFLPAGPLGLGGGRGPAKTLWSAATVKLLGAGLDDAGFTDDISKLIGDHEVPTTNTTSGGTKHGRSTTTSVRRDRILSPAQIRALPRVRPCSSPPAPSALLRLLPWYGGPRAQAIEAAWSAAVAGIANSAARGEAV
jgi:hypothetical protein